MEDIPPEYGIYMYKTSQFCQLSLITEDILHKSAKIFYTETTKMCINH